MKENIKKILKVMLMTFAITITAIGTVAFALTFPASTPVGGTAGGNFMSYFSKILLNTDLATTDGTVKNSDKVDGLHAADLGGGLGAAGTLPVQKIFLFVGQSFKSSCPAGFEKLTEVSISTNNEWRTFINGEMNGSNQIDMIYFPLDEIGAKILYNWQSRTHWQQDQLLTIDLYGGSTYSFKVTTCYKDGN